MRKWLKIALYGLGTIAVLLLVLVLAGPSVFQWMSAPAHRFGDKPLPDAPDYALRAHWSAWPDDASPAERRPDGVGFTPQEARLADAFFLHPTTYGGRERWVQPMDDEETGRETDLGTISRQASAFNGCCRVYAPRYRQSNIMGYKEDEDVNRIMDVGYRDVRAAFRYFVAGIDPDSPIVLGSHSQGTLQMARLIMDEIDGTPLMDRLVAAYAIGHQLPGALIEEGYRDVEVCSSPTQTGCLVSWDAHEGDRTPTPWGNRDNHRNWNGTDYSGFPQSQRICVNPVTWTTDSRPSDKADHLGALTMWTKSTALDAPLGELITGTVSAYCGQGERSNWLFVNADRDPKLKNQGWWSMFGRNLHGSDYDLFWANIRQNAEARTRALIAAREGLENQAPPMPRRG